MDDTKGKISLTSTIVINVPTIASLAVKTKDLLFLWLAHLNNKNNVCIQISSLWDMDHDFLSISLKKVELIVFQSVDEDFENIYE